MKAEYNIEHAREILEPCHLMGNYLRPDERGVWPAIDRDLLLKSETEGLRWRPARQLQDLPGTPEVKDTPMLPNPFTARELAAFMLDGVGALVADFYGEWADGPDPDRLSTIDPDSKARRAVTEAFTAYREAEGIVGPYPRALEADADRARKAYNEANQRANEREGVSGAKPDSTARRARAVASVAAQEAKMHTTVAASRQASEAWLTAMVVCLLEPESQAATEAPELPAPAQTAAPVVADSASNAPACDFSILATREQLIEAFGRFTGMDASWFKNITDTPALLTARKVTGQGGRGHIAEPWFCPFEVMRWLADSKRRKGRKLSTEKAWELLEKNFPKVHSAHSVADPRTGD